MTGTGPGQFTPAELASLDDGSGDIYRAMHDHTVDEHGDLIHACRACLAEAFPADPPEYDPDDAGAQRIAEVFADGNTEYDRIGKRGEVRSRLRALAWLALFGMIAASWVLRDFYHGHFWLYQGTWDTGVAAGALWTGLILTRRRQK